VLAGDGPVGDAPGEHPGLARAGAGQDAQGHDGRRDGASLRIVEILHQGVGIHSADVSDAR
jgi:hypothetical protein